MNYDLLTNIDRIILENTGKELLSLVKRGFTDSIKQIKDVPTVKGKVMHYLKSTLNPMHLPNTLKKEYIQDVTRAKHMLPTIQSRVGRLDRPRLEKQFTKIFGKNVVTPKQSDDYLKELLVRHKAASQISRFQEPRTQMANPEFIRSLSSKTPEELVTSPGSAAGQYNTGYKVAYKFGRSIPGLPVAGASAAAIGYGINKGKEMYDVAKTVIPPTPITAPTVDTSSSITPAQVAVGVTGGLLPIAGYAVYRHRKDKKIQ